MSNWINKWIIGALVIAVLLASVLIEESYDATIPMGEVIGPDEDKVMAAAVASSVHMINNTRDVIIKEASDENEIKPEDRHLYRRDVHIKTHGCVRAKFSVQDIESKYRWGVFEKKKEYKAWIRFSNGDYTYKSDRSPDARGMAIKLTGVEGDQLLASQKGARTQDFVMMNSKNYFIRELEDYVELTNYLAKDSNFGYFLNGPSWNPFTWRLRELRLVGGTKKLAPKSIVNTQFYSASAYKLGPQHNIKFSAKPVTCPIIGEKPKKPKWASSYFFDYNFLRKRLITRLDPESGYGPACFDFMVQLQVPGKNMPVEDATIVWDEDDSPFVTVARIEIEPQYLDTTEQNEFCENLSFNPWHSVAEHRPIGVFNRVRKALYEEVARYRYAENMGLKKNVGQTAPQASGVPPILQQGQPPEPTDWCIDRDRKDRKTCEQAQMPGPKPPEPESSEDSDRPT